MTWQTFLVVLALSATACGGGEPDAVVTIPPLEIPSVAPTPSPTPFMSEVATGLEAPWDVVFTPDGRVFVTERDAGTVSEIIDGQAQVVRRIDGVVESAEGGLLGLAVSPTYATDGELYVYYTAADDNRVARFSVDRPDPAQVILQNIPKAQIHNGGRIAFGPDGMLYVATGDTGKAELAQSRSSLAGKILRVRPDGRIPDDNPHHGSVVWSTGHRNVQGLTWDARGRLWASELGPDRDDEINHIVRGGNYGWPQTTGTTRITGFRPALAVKQPSEASWSGLTFVSGETFPDWGDSLIAAGLRGQRLWRFPITSQGSLGEGEALFTEEYGRFRTARTAADGSLWLLTSNRDGRGNPTESDDRILRFGYLRLVKEDDR